MTKELPRLTVANDKFLREHKDKLSTYEGKFEVFARALGATKSKQGGFSLDTEEDYKAFTDAILLGEWELELFVVNTTQYLGIANFLKCPRDEHNNIIVSENGNVEWEVVDVEEASKFTSEELEMYVPEQSKLPENIMFVSEAFSQWSRDALVQSQLEFEKKKLEKTELTKPGNMMSTEKNGETISNLEEQKEVAESQKLSEEERKAELTKKSIKLVQATYNSKAN